MKIDEGIINRNALDLIRCFITYPEDFVDDKSETSKDRQHLIMLGAISGVLDMADALKNDLKVRAKE